MNIHYCTFSQKISYQILKFLKKLQETKFVILWRKEFRWSCKDSSTVYTNNNMSMHSYIILQLAVTMAMIAFGSPSPSAPGHFVVYSSCEDECNTNQLTCESSTVKVLEHYVCLRNSLSCKLKCRTGGETVVKHQRRKSPHHHHQHKSLKYNKLMKKYNRIKKIVFGKKRLI